MEPDFSASISAVTSLRNHQVRSLDIAPFKYPERAQVEAIDGDVRDRATVFEATRDIDVIVHAAAALHA